MFKFIFSKSAFALPLIVLFCGKVCFAEIIDEVDWGSSVSMPNISKEISMSPMLSLEMSAVHNEAVLAAKDDAVQVSLGEAPTVVFRTAVDALKEENPQLEKKTDLEIANIIVELSSSNSK